MRSRQKSLLSLLFGFPIYTFFLYDYATRYTSDDLDYERQELVHGKGGVFLLVGVVGLQFFIHHFTCTYLVGMITMIMMTDNEFHVKFIR